MTKKEILDAIHGKMIIYGPGCKTGRYTCNPYQQHS